MPTDRFPYPEASYAARLVPEPTTDGRVVYSAWYEELPGCESQGETWEEARHNLTEAFELYVTDLMRRGLEVPPPAYARIREAAWYGIPPSLPDVLTATPPSYIVTPPPALSYSIVFPRGQMDLPGLVVHGTLVRPAPEERRDEVTTSGTA